MAEVIQLFALRSPDIEKIGAALAKAQGVFLVPKKTKTATVQMRDNKGVYSYKYADLLEIREAITPSLSANGIALIQQLDADNCRLITMLLHESGQYLACTYNLPEGLAAQQFGSALTYARRYSVTSLTGVVADEDDDAQVVQKYTERQVKNQKTSAIFKPAVKQTINGTASPALPKPPAGKTRDDILRDVKDAYIPYMKLYPSIDLSTEMYARYGAKKLTDMSTEEAWDFYCFLNDGFMKGTQNGTEPRSQASG